MSWRLRVNKTVVTCVAIVAIALVEVMALSKGIDGAYLSIAIGAIGAAGGFVAGTKTS